LNDSCNSRRGIASDAILVRDAAGLKNSGSMQEIMNKRIDRDHCANPVSNKRLGLPMG